jgi:hypothetical protein
MVTTEVRWRVGNSFNGGRLVKTVDVASEPARVILTDADYVR